jgi:hypothetical protein
MPRSMKFDTYTKTGLTIVALFLAAIGVRQSVALQAEHAAGTTS